MSTEGKMKKTTSRHAPCSDRGDHQALAACDRAINGDENGVQCMSVNALKTRSDKVN